MCKIKTGMYVNSKLGTFPTIKRADLGAWWRRVIQLHPTRFVIETSSGEWSLVYSMSYIWKGPEINTLIAMRSKSVPPARTGSDAMSAQPMLLNRDADLLHGQVWQAFRVGARHLAHTVRTVHPPIKFSCTGESVQPLCLHSLIKSACTQVQTHTNWWVHTAETSPFTKHKLLAPGNSRHINKRCTGLCAPVNEAKRGTVPPNRGQLGVMYEAPMRWCQDNEDLQHWI